MTRSRLSSKIDLTIKNSKRLLYESISADIAIMTAVLSVGLFSGILNSTARDALMLFGGVNFVKGVADHWAQLVREPAAIRDSKYYFLWKVRSQARSRH
jgi:hypothetical protein